MTRSVVARWTTARYLLGQMVPFALLVWLGTLAVAAVITIAVSIFGEVFPSAWDVVMQVARWFVAGIGWYVTYTLLPSHVAYGQTRRAFLRQAVPFAIVATTAFAGLAVAGFALEGLLHRAMGWPVGIDAARIFAGPDQAGIVFAAIWIQFAAWLLAGGLIGVAGYRDDGSLLAAIPAALLAVSLAALAVDPDGLPFLDRFLGARSIPAAVAVGLWLFGCLLTAGLTWLMARGMPLRTRPA